MGLKENYMNKLTITLSILIFLTFNLNAQWEILNEGFIGGATTIEFINENVGWIGGWGESLLKTTDAGENWNTIPIMPSFSLRMFDFFNESLGWAVGMTYDSSASYAMILETYNGGDSWLIQKQILNKWFNTIFVIDENNVYALSDSSMYKTSDGGLNWRDIALNLRDTYCNSMWFLNPDTGVVVGNHFNGTVYSGIILRTTDGGGNWDQTLANEFNNITGLQFINDNAGYFIGQLDTSNFLCKTEDLFEKWQVITQQSYWVYSYHFLDHSTAFAVKNDVVGTGKIIKSSNGGITWKEVQSFPFMLDKIYCNTSGKEFLIGGIFGNSIVCKSSNGWIDWEIKKFSYPGQDVYFLNNDKGFLVGGMQGLHFESTGDIFTTSDGGKTWNLGHSLGEVIKACTFINDFTGFCLTFGGGLGLVGEGGFSRIYRTTDTGGKWEQIYQFNSDLIGYSFLGNDIYFENDRVGWTVGRYTNNTSGAGIFKTTNSGLNWILVWQDLSSGNFTLNSICFNNTTGWAVGESGMIVKYSQIYGWSVKSSPTDQPLKKVFSVDNNVWISGGYLNEGNSSAIFLKSTDNGETWSKNQNIPYLINDMYFRDNSFGWAVGRNAAYNGVLLISTNGGDKWEVIVDNLPGQLNSIFIRENYGWAAGELGLVLKTTDAGTTWVDDKNNKIYPAEFELEQNYPNPFNPTTNFEFRIANLPAGKAGFGLVTLKVYDVLGNEITTLVNEEKSAGEYKIEFDGSKLPSGIYFYKLQSGNYSSTKKMILIK
jgi:photosystem II stability/assembly factor-like uncharacterized protein